MAIGDGVLEVPARRVESGDLIRLGVPVAAFAVPGILAFATALWVWGGFGARLNRELHSQSVLSLRQQRDIGTLEPMPDLNQTPKPIDARQGRKSPRYVYKYTCAKTAKIVLDRLTIRFQSPLNFNDPFDSQWDAYWQLESQEYKGKYASTLHRSIKDTASWPQEADPRHIAIIRKYADLVHSKSMTMKQAQRELKELLPHNQDSDELKRRQKIFLQNLRIFCASEIPNNLLMWSHYADQHKGFVFKFNTMSIEKTLRKEFRTILYSDSYVSSLDLDAWANSAVFGIPHVNTRQIHNVLLTKHTDWAYEREWRIYSQFQIDETDFTGMHDDIQIPVTAIDSIYAGSRCPQHDFEEVRSICARNMINCDMFKFRQAKAKFALEKQDL